VPSFAIRLAEILQQFTHSKAGQTTHDEKYADDFDICIPIHLFAVSAVIGPN